MVAGYSYNGLNYDFALARYNANGSLDSTFGTGGKVTTSILSTKDDLAWAIAIQSDGKIVVAGNTFNGSDTLFALVRYNVNGSLDTTFGTGGKVTTAIGDVGASAYAITIQSDGKIIIAGNSDYLMSPPNVYSSMVALARYNSNGTPDITFGSGGVVTTILGQQDYGFALALQTDGKIVVAGSAANANYD